MAGHTHIPAPRNTIETYSARPEREAPRNEAGEIVCQHEACRDKHEIFRRPCEWNKHMDKHERPYKCNEPTCEQNPGFTYSGGLLRHMREVHKKGVGPTRRPLYCPHANCIRSTGEGFTRRENLEEHLRRRHSYTGHYSPPPQSTSAHDEENQDQPRKRRKTTEPESPNGEHPTQVAQQQSQNLQDGRTDSLRTDLQPVIDERLYLNGTDVELDRAEAIRQLAIARQTIIDQQDIITRQDHELHHLRTSLQSVINDPGYSSRIIDRGPAALEDVPGALSAQVQQHDSYPALPENPAPPINGNHQVESHAQQDAMTAQDAQLISQLSVDRDAQSNGNEPSRRIEIARDLVSERLASAKVV